MPAVAAAARLRTGSRPTRRWLGWCGCRRGRSRLWRRGHDLDLQAAGVFEIQGEIAGGVVVLRGASIQRLDAARLEELRDERAHEVPSGQADREVAEPGMPAVVAGIGVGLLRRSDAQERAGAELRVEVAAVRFDCRVSRFVSDAAPLGCGFNRSLVTRRTPRSQPSVGFLKPLPAELGSSSA